MTLDTDSGESRVAAVSGATPLYLVRHAIAEDRGSAWSKDALRPLTEQGRRRFVAAAAGLARLEGIPARILTSPYERARQTAELLAAAGRSGTVVDLLPLLEPGHPPSTVLARVRKEARGEPVALVGHEPDLGLLAAALLGTARPIPFKKGAICRIDVAWGRVTTGTLVWFLPPGALRRLGR
jgi:phosphohistidine phosphatase